MQIEPRSSNLNWNWTGKNEGKSIEIIIKKNCVYNKIRDICFGLNMHILLCYRVWPEKNIYKM